MSITFIACAQEKCYRGLILPKRLMISKQLLEDFNLKFEVSGCFLEYNSRFLVLLRQDHKPQGNTWSVPAGKVNTFEAPEATMARELLEETGYQANPEDFKLIDVFNVRHSGYDFVYRTFKLVLNEQPVITLEPAEHKDYRWVTPQEALLLDLISDEDACIKSCYKLD